MDDSGSLVRPVGCGCLAVSALLVTLLVVMAAMMWSGRGVLAPRPDDGAPTEVVDADGTVICNRFDVQAALGQGTLTLSLDTDLPDDTRLWVGVSRPYTMKRNPSSCSVDYFQEFGTVADWRTPRTIPVDHALFRREFLRARKRMAYIGTATEVVEIRNQIEVSFAVPVGQTNPAFGEHNEYLSGKMVQPVGKSGGLRRVDVRRRLFCPLDAQPSYAVPTVRLAPLEIGGAYQLSEGTPLSADAAPDATEGPRVGPGGRIVVLDVRTGSPPGRPWYRVLAAAANGENLGEGWLDSVWLVGQEVEKTVAPSPAPPP